jgi:uncharacterized protein (TIGR00369 family)
MEASPEQLHERARALTGLEFIRGMIDDSVPRPPVAQALGISVMDVDLGAVTFRLTPADYMANHLGLVAGGILATALDAALGCSILTALPQDRDIVTLDLSLDFLAPVRLNGGPVSLVARTVHVGSRRALAHGQVLDGTGKLCATGRSSCLVTPNR